MQHQRIFAALNLSMESHRQLSEFQRGLRAASPKGVNIRWVPPANLHLTMKFYGPCHPEQTEAVSDAAAKAAGSVSPFSLGIGGLGVFPNPAKARVLWLGLTDGTNQVAGLHDALEDSSDELGFERDARPFRSHLTLARIKDPGPGLEQWLGEHGERLPTCAPSRIDELVVYESRLHPGGAEYIPLSRHPLGRRSTRS